MMNRHQNNQINYHYARGQPNHRRNRNCGHNSSNHYNRNQAAAAAAIQHSQTSHHHHHCRHCPPLLDEDFTFISPYVKYSLFFFNLIFWLIGTTLISLGVWSFFEEYEYNLFKLRNIFDFILHISVALVFSGSVIFSMSLMGCLGALRENLCLIKLVSTLIYCLVLK